MEEKEYEITFSGSICVHATSQEEAAEKAERRLSEVNAPYSLSEFYAQATGEVVCLTDMDPKDEEEE